MNISNTQKNKGFVILFAMLISTVILLIASGIFNVVQKEVVLSSYARESQRAFFAADSALECGLYADLVGVVPTATGPATPFSVFTSSDNIFECGGLEVESSYLSSASSSAYEYPFVFRYRNGFSEDTSCAYVLVEKESTNDITDGTEVRITAVGFNVCTDNNGLFTGTLNVPDYNDPTLLERRLSLTYVQ